MSRLKVLGVNAAGTRLWLSLMNVDRVLEPDPAWVELHEGTEAGYAMTSFQSDCRHALTASSPDRVVILDMEQVGKGPTVTALRTRFTAEALLASCAVEQGIRCVRLARGTLRSRLSLPRKGKLASHVGLVFEIAVGPHWLNKRDLAALAARAEIVGG